MNRPHQPPDNPSTAPESGTVRDETTGTNPSPPDRGAAQSGNKAGAKDDPSQANEEK